MTRLFALMLCLLPFLLSAQDLTGDWHGTLDISGMQLRLVLHITETDGEYATTMDSPDQGATDIPMDKTVVTGNSVQISMAAAQISMEGIYLPAADSLHFDFKQGPLRLPLGMNRQKVEAPVYHRPQEPTDFPYQREEVSFVNAEGGHRLAGTLTLPPDGQFEQVAVLVSGSGPQDRDEALLQHKPFLVLSDYLTRKGIAVLRYDDRGIAASEGDFDRATSADFATDASAALAYLRERDDLNDKQFGVIGHSEGGMIAPMVASREAVDFIVLLAGPGTRLDTLLLSQTTLVAEASGEDPDDIALTQKVMRYEIQLVQRLAEVAQVSFRQHFQDSLQSWLKDLSPAEQEALEMSVADFAAAQAQGLTTPWFRYFLNFDPADYLTQVKCPVLAINGSLDLQVPAEANLAAIEEALTAGGNPHFVVKELPGLNHLFQTAETGSPEEYAQIEETFNEAAMLLVAEWIKGLE